MSRRSKYANEEERRAAKREYFKRYRAATKKQVEGTQFKYWAKKLRQAGWTVIEPGGNGARG